MFVLFLVRFPWLADTAGAAHFCAAFAIPAVFTGSTRVFTNASGRKCLTGSYSKEAQANY
jgi:hypothetical protein